LAKNLTGQTLFFENPPGIVDVGTVVGPEEKNGPFGSNFDLSYEDAKCDEDTWEKGEKKMVSDAISIVLGKTKIDVSDIDHIIGGDLLNQIAISSYTARDYNIPYLGVYGACSTLVEGMGIGASLMDGGFADCVMTYCSSHYQTAERQYRTPLEYGAQYPPYKQFTVTGAGAYLLGWLNTKVVITHTTFGKVIDLGVKDANDMGSAMAPAAADTVLQHFNDIKRGPQDYDLIVTGDLGRTGKNVLLSLLKDKKLNKIDNFFDCGDEIYASQKKYGAGGSGCAASAVIFGSSIMPDMIKGELNRILLVGTGALLSPLTVLQGESIPGIAHAVVIEKVN
jgi:stage V sporulation protein AD